MKHERARLRPADGLVTVLLVLLAWMADSVNRSALLEVGSRVPTLDLVMLAAVTLPIFFRRRYPLTVLTVVTVSFLAVRFLEVPEGTITSLALFLALFSAGAYSHHPRRDLARGAAVAVSMASLLWSFVGGDLPGNVVLFRVFSLLLNTAFFAAGWLMGDLWRRRAEDQLELARRAAEMEEQRHQLAEQAVARERLRIAQELHDVVAHHVSLMGVQAGAARRSLPSGATQAADLLEGIETEGRRAVSEMGRLVGLLRSPGEEMTKPQPTLESLDELVGQMRTAGLQVDLHRVGRPRALDTTADLAAYRVVQEALTNALKHGSRHEATVVVSYLVEALSIRVRNPATAGNGDTGGQGLIGMRERVTVAGGTLAADRRPDGRFELHATLPYREET